MLSEELLGRAVSALIDHADNWCDAHCHGASLGPDEHFPACDAHYELFDAYCKELTRVRGMR